MRVLRAWMTYLMEFNTTAVLRKVLDYMGIWEWGLEDEGWRGSLMLEN